jgi:hypothetical protein
MQKPKPRKARSSAVRISKADRNALIILNNSVLRSLNAYIRLVNRLLGLTEKGKS